MMNFDLTVTTKESDLGIVIYNSIKISPQCLVTVIQANRTLGI